MSNISLAFMYSPFKSIFCQFLADTLTIAEFFCCDPFHGCGNTIYCPVKTVFFQEPIKCKAPGNPKNGHSSGGIYTVGAEVTFSCEEGYQLMGITKITCLESGEWSHLIPYCEGMFS